MQSKFFSHDTLQPIKATMIELKATWVLNDNISFTFSHIEQVSWELRRAKELCIPAERILHW